MMMTTTHFALTALYNRAKEFILKEAYPYFADNKQDAIWDLAHLKRYVKLSKGLEGTGDYYYQGDVDSEGN